MSMFTRFAADLSEPLFNSVYGEMYAIADKAQKSAIRGSITEEQQTFSDFCNGKLSLGDALKFIQTQKAYTTPLKRG